MINDRLKKLRKLMSDKEIDAYIVTTSDPHQSEYLADHFKTREYISGFTGSAGTVVVTRDKAILWTDGRYFVQAENELKYSEFELYKMGNPDYPVLIDFLKSEVRPNGKIAFDGSVVSYKFYRELLENLGTRLLINNVDLIGDIWDDRPGLPKDKIFIHEEKYSGESPHDRIEKLREEMKELGVDYYLISALDEVCYLYSIRGNDVKYNPVAISYGLVSMDEAFLFIDPDKLEINEERFLNDNGIKVLAYGSIADSLAAIGGKNTIFFDPRTVNISLVENINSNVRRLKKPSLVEMQKAVKNEVELDHQRKAYIKDGIALVKFFNWLEAGVSTGLINEVSAADKLGDFRREWEDFKEESFETISAYGPNAAMPHYSPENKGDTIENKGLYLCDSGGQYLDGTTDITRTYAVGELSYDEKYHYTMVLKSHIALASAHFKEGSTGYYLDAFARYPLLKENLDFNHGTGHGVGYFLNVHEGPMNISSRYNGVELKPGMVVSIEPGLYIEGSHGIRTENIATVCELEENEFGKFYGFEILSFAPIDTRPLILDLLNKDEIDWLNAYNKEVYDKLNDGLEGSDLEYLEKMTREVQA